MLHGEEQGGELCRSVKGYIDSILSDKSDANDENITYSNNDIMVKVRALFAIEEDSIDEWAMDIARNRFDSYYYFDKTPFLHVLDSEVVNRDGMVDLIIECVSDLHDRYYSVLSEARDDEQIKEFEQLLEHIHDLIHDTHAKDRFECVL